MAVQTLQLKPAAAEIYRALDDLTVAILFCGRRFGKTRLLLIAGIARCLKQPQAQVFYLAPSRKMAKDISWRTLKELVPQEWCRDIWESTLTVEFLNGSRLVLGGFDYADNLRGQSADLILGDEFAFAQAESFQEAMEGAIWPMLGTSPDGKILLASTPCGGGTYSTDLWERAANTPKWQRWNYPSIAGGWIKESFVEQAKATMDAALWRQEFYGSIESLIGAVYRDFCDKNIRPVVDDGHSPVLVGLDFNRSPFCAAILQVQGETLACLEEIVLMNADTREMALEIRDRYPNRQVWVAPDPTGSRKQTSSLGYSDHALLKEIGGFQVVTPKAAWRVRDKVNATRLIIRDANGNRRLQVDPSCKRVIRSLKNLEFKPGLSAPDPDSEHGHMADALGYAALALSKGLVPWTVGKGRPWW